MPIWGQRLKREGGDETYVRGCLFEILLYLESLVGGGTRRKFNRSPVVTYTPSRSR